MSHIKIFLSHARSEKTFDQGADQYARALKDILSEKDTNTDYTIFVDQDGIKNAEDWRVRILNEVTTSHIFLFSGTQSWFESQWCLRELKEFAKSGRRVGTDDLPVGRAIVPIAHSDIDFSRVPWLRRVNARLANRLIQTRQRPNTATEQDPADAWPDPATTAQQIIKIREDLQNMQPIRMPPKREYWTFLPVGLKIISAAIAMLAIGVSAYLVRNQVTDMRDIRAKKGAFQQIVRNQSPHVQDMRVAVNTLSSNGLPSRLPNLRANEGEAFGNQWGFAVSDIERYFKPLADCLEQQSCIADDVQDLCTIAKTAIDGHHTLVKFFYSGGDGRGFHFAMGGSSAIFGVTPGTTVKEPALIHAPKFYTLACTDKPVVPVSGASTAPACQDDLKFALSWATSWQNSAPEGQINKTAQIRNALTAISEKLRLERNILTSEFAQGVEDLKLIRQERRPDIAPDELDRVLINRLERGFSRAANMADALDRCIATGLTRASDDPDSIALGAGLMLDSFVSGVSATRFLEVHAILADRSQRDAAALTTVADHLEQNYAAFMKLSNENYLKCNSIMSGMFTDPSFRFRLRNRNDTENAQRIIALSQRDATTPIGDIRRTCAPN